MGMIQQGVNQLFGTLATAARLSPNYETRQEMHALKKKEKGLQMQSEALPKISGAEMEEGRTVYAKEHKRILEEQAKVAQRKFELKPSKQTMPEAVKLKSATEDAPLMTFPSSYEDIEGNDWGSPEEAQWANEQINKGQKRAINKGQQQVKQRRNFMAHLKNVEISGGGTVGELPSHVQKAIAAQYSKKERKELMDRQDKQSKGGNK